MAQERQPQKESLIPSIVSILPALIQLVAVMVVSLSDIFRFSEFFFNPSLLPAINLFVVIFIISIIGAINWREGKILYLTRQQDEIINPQKSIYSLIKKLLVTQIFSLLILIFSIIAKIAGDFLKLSMSILQFLQFASYAIFLSASGVIIYIWLSDYIKRRQAYQREDFIPNLLKSLRDQGFIGEPQVKILKNQFLQNYAGRYVVASIKGKKYHLTVSIDGLEINEIYTDEEFKKLSQTSSTNQSQ